MEKENLIITIGGHCGSGKSRLMFLLKNFLRENGFDVEYTGNLDHRTEANFDRVMSVNFDNVINNIKEKKKLILKEVQFNRESKSS